MTAPRDVSSVSEVDDLINAIEQGKLLGASKQILQIADLFCQLSRSQETASATDIVATIREAGERIIAIRGQEAPTVADAVRSLLDGLQALTNREELAAALSVRADALRARIRKSQQDLAVCGTAVLSAGRGPVVVFDYSSSVMGVLAMCAQSGHLLPLVVPESRVLNGGIPVVAEALDQGHAVVFTADGAIGAYLRGARAVITGAEAILADGSCINTIGSFTAAVLARYHHVPLYVVSDVSKVYAPSYHGHSWPLRERTPTNLMAVVPESIAGHANLTVVSPEVERIPPSLITAYVTDQGLLPASAIYTAGRRGS